GNQCRRCFHTRPFEDGHQQVDLVLAVTVAPIPGLGRRVWAVRVLAHFGTEVPDLVLYRPQGSAYPVERIVKAGPFNQTRVQLRRQGVERWGQGGGPGHDVGPALRPCDLHERIWLVPGGITAVIQHGGGAVDVERRLGGVRRADDLRGRRAVLAMDGEVGPRVAQYPQVHIQHRAAPAHVAPVRHLARENRVAAGDGVAHADQVVDANVLEHDERGNFTVGEVALEIALPSGKGNLVRLEPVQPGAIPTHLDPVYPQLLVPGVESDLDATGIAEHRRRDGFVNEVDMALAAVHSAVDLHVIQPVAPTPIGRARRGGIPLRRDLTWLDEIGRAHV